MLRMIYWWFRQARSIGQKPKDLVKIVGCCLCLKIEVMKEPHNDKGGTHLWLLWGSRKPAMIKELLIVLVPRLATTKVDQDMMEAVSMDDKEILMSQFREHACQVRGIPKLVVYIEET